MLKSSTNADIPLARQDMIGRTVLDTSLNSQTGYNALADTMLSQLSWHKFNTGASFLGNLNFVRTFVHWRNGRIMDQYIGAELDKRFDEYKRDTESSASKSIIHLTLKEYIKTTGKDTDKLDPHFRAFAIRQIRLFIFAGYDSTGSSICYCFHLLSQHPDVTYPFTDCYWATLIGVGLKDSPQGT